MRGRFVVLDGIDGCGKSTQLQALATWLPGSGLLPAGAELRLTREPGGTALGQALRQLLLHPPGGAAPEISTELLLYAADRAQHVQQLIEPALAAGHWVLSDRYSGSTAAYQGFGRGLPMPLIDQLEQIATGGLQPDLTLWLDLPLAAARRRRDDRLGHDLGDRDRIEAAGEAFLARVQAGFVALAAQRGWHPIAADQPPEQVTADCCQAMLQGLTGAGHPAAASPS